MTNTEQQAQKLYDQMTTARDGWIRMGMQPTGAMAGTVDELEAHLNLVDEVAQEFGFALDASKIEFGSSRDEIVALAESKRKRYNRRAGVRALEQKYGHEGAARIVRRHSGRTIR